MGTRPTQKINFALCVFLKKENYMAYTDYGVSEEAVADWSFRKPCPDIIL